MPPSIPNSGRARKKAPSELEADNHAFVHGGVTTDALVDRRQARPTLPPVPPSPGVSETSAILKLSRKRWFVLFAISIFGLSLALAGETSSIFGLLLKLLDLEEDRYIYISQIFHYLSLVLMGPTAIFVDKFGIRAGTHAAVCFFILNGLFKVLLYFTRLPGWSYYKMYYYLLSCTFGTWTYLLFIVLPLKVSETWFSVSERSVAWTVLMVQDDLGHLVAAFVYPRLIHVVDDFKLLAYIWIGAVTTTTVSCVACVTRSEPDHPPSLRMAEASKYLKVPFSVSIMRMLKHKDILLHVLHGGIYGSLGYSVAVVIQDIMASIGLNSIFVSNYMSINAVVSIVMLLTMSTFVHRASNPLLACKLGSFAQATLFMALLVSLRLSAPGWAILLVSIACTICRSFTSPHSNNIIAHMACGTVSQATVMGFSVIVGTVLISIVQVSFAYLIDKEHAKNKYHHSLMLVGIICVLNEVVYLIFFQGSTVASKHTAQPNGQAGAENPAYEHDEEAARP